MRTPRPATLSGLSLVFAVAVAACSGTPDSTCPAGDTTCSPFHPDAAAGNDTGAANDAAADHAAPQPDTGLPGDDAAVDSGSDAEPQHDAAADTGGGGDASDAGGLLAFGAACTANAQCQSNLCFDFKARGMFCTKTCATANDCPGGAGGLGCNGMGVCKTQ